MTVSQRNSAQLLFIGNCDSSLTYKTLTQEFKQGLSLSRIDFHLKGEFLTGLKFYFTKGKLLEESTLMGSMNENVKVFELRPKDFLQSIQFSKEMMAIRFLKLETSDFSTFGFGDPPEDFELCDFVELGIDLTFKRVSILE